ncbi:MAG: glutaredoxin family protein [Pseudomonadota bacterium]
MTYINRNVVTIPAVSLALLLATSTSGAVTIVECVDTNGDTTFAERCPAGWTKKGEKEIRGVRKAADEEVSIDEIAKAHPITLFAVANCEACTLVRNQLKARDIPFTEIDVNNDQEKYEQLTAATGGAATVPTLTIDDKVLTGHNSASLDAALADAGYP